MVVLGERDRKVFEINMNGRNIGVDFLRLLAILSVIIVHLPLVDDACKSQVQRVLPYGNACFALLAGWYMFGVISAMQNIDAFKEWLRNRSRRLLVPYVVWTIIHLSLATGLALLQHTYEMPTLRDWYNFVFCGAGATQLWFLISLFYAQMTVPVLLLLCKNTTFLLAFGMLVLYGGSAFLPVGWGFRNYTFIFGMVTIGLAFRMILDMPRIRQIVVMPMPKTFLICLAGGGMMLPSVCNVGDFWPVGVFGWCAFFGLVGSCCKVEFRGISASLINVIGSSTMGIYLSHWLVTRMIFKPLIPLGADYITDGRVLIIVSAFLILLLSMLFSWVFRKHKWLVG